MKAHSHRTFTLSLLTVPPKQLRLVQAWVELHRDDLFVDWDLAANGEEPFRIAPLQ